MDRLFEQARRDGAVMPTGLRRITQDERDYYFDKLVADDQGERRLPDHVRRRYMAYMQDDGSPRCSEVLERWVRERQPPSKTEAERRETSPVEGVNPFQGITEANVTGRGSSAPPVRQRELEEVVLSRAQGRSELLASSTGLIPGCPSRRTRAMGHKYAVTLCSDWSGVELRL